MKIIQYTDLTASVPANQFVQDEVNYLGCKITNTGFSPTDAFVEIICSFPSPKNLTDVRAWFGTINQVSYSFAIAEQMVPLRKLLSSKLPFVWLPELDTALSTDWSRLAVCCWLSQKFCDCHSTISCCCSKCWQTVHVSSRYNHQQSLATTPLKVIQN